MARALPDTAASAATGAALPAAPVRTSVSARWAAYRDSTLSSAPLIVFRIVFSLLLLGSLLRFWAKGWIEELYIRPTFFFSYYGFEWVKPLGPYTYGLFILCGLSALLVAIGLWYRVAAALLFLSFTYIELMDKTTYLNHYYFVSLICLLLVFLPAHTAFSVDAWRRKRSYTHVPRYTVDILRVMMGILYVYAGLAKLNSDWLLEAQPLRTWLPAKNNLPVLGPLFNQVWVAYLFSWFGCLYDLTIPFWLSWKKSRPWAFLAVVVFHVLTAILFPIGMFPYIMIASALIFFPADFHQVIVDRLRLIFRIRKPFAPAPVTFAPGKRAGKALRVFLAVFVVVQLFLPFRYAMYPGELFWTEEGYRFSWRVMLMEKTGYAVFTVKEPLTGRKVQVNNWEYLTPLQEKQMSFQPDMILQFAHHLAADYRARGWKDPAVYVEDYVSLNGRPSRLFIDSAVNLAAEKESFKHKNWIIPFSDDLQGL
ncbi:MAG TPA: HTTM domain-containing protein [Chitinophagaceae bacterium]|nr:HTTM domain-containing protein [Chitinophagaceae bacterium]